MRRQERSQACGRCHRPRWWLLYTIAVLFVAAVGLVEVSVAGEGLRKILETLAVILGFGLVLVWQRRNRIALDLERERWRA